MKKGKGKGKMAHASAQQEAIEHALAMAERQVPLSDQIQLQEWARPACPTLFHLSARSDVPREAVEEAVAMWVKDAGVDMADTILYGDVPSRWWKVELSDGEAGIVRAKRLGSLLKTAAGWRTFEVKSLHGSGVEPLFVALDRSPQDQRKEMRTKQVCRIVQRLSPSCGCYPKKQQGTVEIAKVGIVQVLVDGPSDPTRLMFNRPKLAALGIDADEIRRLFEETHLPVAEVPWSS